MTAPTHWTDDPRAWVEADDGPATPRADERQDEEAGDRFRTVRPEPTVAAECVEGALAGWLERWKAAKP